MASVNRAVVFEQLDLKLLTIRHFWTNVKALWQIVPAVLLDPLVVCRISTRGSKPSEIPF